KSAKTKQIIAKLTKGYLDKKDYFIDNLSCSLAKIAASVYPNPAIVRLSDFKTNEYFNLIGGDEFEFKEENPMLGFRGASRYYNNRYIDGFTLECSAIKKARELLGLDNIVIMVPFCRTIKEADKVLKVLSDNGLKRGEKNLKIYVMAEIPSNIILAKEFSKRFDGFSIGSNDLTQLILGIDRDSKELSEIFDENNLLDLSILWDGNGSNRNAALTIYRHFDSSSVIKGLYGDTPKTAWVIGYPLLERIHYLLVAGFDVYGNVGHQLLTRLYMDFLRMEGEYNFLRLLPKDVAQQELDFWYRGEEARVEGYLKELHDRESETSAIVYKTDNPKKEVFNLIRKQFGEQVIAIDRI
ncbi:hypothetical protein LCGC14_3056990, partial [marine sediment metagenome]